MESIPKKSGIYQIRNLVNGKVYVGSSVNLNRRRNVHFYKLRHNMHDNLKLQNAFNKYGETSFVFEIIEIVDDKCQLLNKEQYYIDKYNVIQEGYNILPNAYSTLGFCPSAESRNKMSIAHKGKHISEEQKRKISIGNTGRKRTEEQKCNISNNRKGKGARQVVCLETKQIFNSINEASGGLIDTSSISKCCRGLRETAGGYHWEYV